MSLDEKIKCHNFLFENYDFTPYSNLITHHLEFLSDWDLYIIPLEHADRSLNFLKSNQLQRALTTILDFYKLNCYLKTFIEFKKLADQLSSIRFKKQQKKITTEIYLKRKENIESQLKEWIHSKTFKPSS